MAVAVNDERRLWRSLHRGEVIHVHGRRDRDERADASVVRTDRHRDVRAEGEAAASGDCRGGL